MSAAFASPPRPTAGRGRGGVYIALLRGINVGGNKKIAMADLRALLEQLGLDDVKTLLNSGNVVFSAPKRATASLERELQLATADALGVETEYIVRTAAEWSDIIERNPFPKDTARDPSHCIVMTCRDKLDQKRVAELRDAAASSEVMEASGRELYLVYGDGIGTSKLTNVMIERKLGTIGTARNWNTVLKIAALL